MKKGFINHFLGQNGSLCLHRTRKMNRTHSFSLCVKLVDYKTDECVHYSANLLHKTDASHLLLKLKYSDREIKQKD
jgi:hypothetical protein